MPSKENQLYQENHTKRVKHEVVWLDAHFRDWLETTYGNADAILSDWASVVSLTPGDGIARSLPTGGRVFVYDLKQPYLDPVSKLPCFQIDVKGVGLTKSGYQREKDYLEDIPYREFMFCNGLRQEYFGPLDLVTAKDTIRHLRFVRKKNLFAPLPLAVIKLKQLVLEGIPLNTKKIKSALENFEPEDEFALIIRAYPVSATRVIDLTQWTDVHTPYLHWNGDRSPYKKVVNHLNRARRLWQNYELPRILSAFGKRFGRNPGLFYYRWWKKMAINEAAKMIAVHFTPVSGRENGRFGAEHTHLQNHTTVNTHVEWTPLVNLARIGGPKMSYLEAHLWAVLTTEHDALINAGICSLPISELNELTGFSSFKKDVFSQLGRMSGCEDICRTYEALLKRRYEHGPGDELVLFAQAHAKNLV